MCGETKSIAQWNLAMDNKFELKIELERTQLEDKRVIEINGARLWVYYGLDHPYKNKHAEAKACKR